MGVDMKYGIVTVEHEPHTPLNDSDEPVIVFRAQDKLSVPMLARYENLYVQAQPDSFNPDEDEFVQKVRSVREEFLRWQGENADKVKLPD
jgi:hypothetical protein